jgi:hypothetical protein
LIKSILLLLVVCLFSTWQLSGATELAPGDSVNLHLTDVNEVGAAQQINSAMDRITSRVMACIEAQNGESIGCTCESRSKCRFKEEYDAFIGTFCEVIDKYPKWKVQNVFYQEGKGAVGHTLATRNINLHYGKECK